MALDIDQLRTFCDLCLTKNFTKTASNLDITESTVSYRIKEMEKYFEKKLFHRRADKTVDCTEFGDGFFPEAQEILSIIAKHRDTKEEGELSGTIRVSTGEIGGVYVLPSAVRAFERKFSKIKLKIEINNSLETLHKLSESECDVGITATVDFRPNPYYRNHEAMDLVKVSYGVVVPLGHPLLKKEKVSVTDLVGIPYISRSENSGGYREILKMLAEKGMGEEDLNIVWRFENSSSVINAVSEGLGVAIVSRIQSSRHVQAGIVGFVPLDTGIESHLKLIDNWKGTNSVVDAFVKFLKYFVETSMPSL